MALLARLQTEHPNDNDITRLLDTAREDQAEQRKLTSLTEARGLLTSRNYEACIALLVGLQTQYLKDTDIAKLLEIAREDLAEQQKQLQLAEARRHLAARRFEEAMSALEAIRQAHPKDSGIIKLHSLVLQEKEKQASLERLQRELAALKQLVSEKKYPEVLAQSERIQKEFPGNADFARLLDFARTQQAQIERESQQQKFLLEVKKLFDSAQFEEAFQLALAGLKTFPDNRELQILRDQADNQQRKLETRQHIEQRIREIKVKINRGKISEAIDLANQTLMTHGPDTGVTQLLNSARVEYEAREKKKGQDGKLAEIRSLITSGKLLDATRALDDAVAEKILEVFDPRVQRICEELERAKSVALASATTETNTPTVSLSKEYAWLQGPPEPEVAPRQETHPPAEALDAKALTSPPVSQPPPPDVPPTVLDSPPPFSAATLLGSAPDVESGVPSTPSPAIPARRTETPRLIPPVPSSEPTPFPAFDWKKPAKLVAIAAAAIALVWGAVRIIPMIRTHEPAQPVTPKPTPKVEPSPLEVQQRDAMSAADKLVAANDLEGALRVLNPAANLNGPLTSDIKKKQAGIEESMQNKNLRELRRKEEQLWQQANDDVSAGRFADSQKKLRQILALGDGALRKNDAQQYLTHTIPAREEEEKLFSQARQASQKGDLNSLQNASDVLKRLIARDGGRKSDAEKMLQDVRGRIYTTYSTGARQDLQRGDFHAARLKAGLIQQNGADAGTLISDIDQAEQTRLTQLEGQFSQLKQSDDDASAQQLGNLQRGFQAIVDSSGPRSEEAKGFVNNLPSAIREVHDRAANKRSEAAYQQLLTKYQAASGASDKTGLEAARTAFQSIAKSGGPHANDAQKFVDDIGTKLAALNQPPPPVAPPVKPDTPSGPTDSDAVLALVKRYSQAFEQRNPQALQQIWPAMGQSLYARYKNSFESASSIRMQVQTESVNIAPDGNTATVTAQVTQDYTPQGQKPKTVKGRSIFQFAKSNGSWVITNVQ
jgi:hypothetical protein